MVLHCLPTLSSFPPTQLSLLHHHISPDTVPSLIINVLDVDEPTAAYTPPPPTPLHAHHHHHNHQHYIAPAREHHLPPRQRSRRGHARNKEQSEIDRGCRKMKRGQQVHPHPDNAHMSALTTRTTRTKHSQAPIEPSPPSSHSCATTTPQRADKHMDYAHEDMKGFGRVTDQCDPEGGNSHHHHPTLRFMSAKPTPDHNFRVAQQAQCSPLPPPRVTRTSAWRHIQTTTTTSTPARADQRTGEPITPTTITRRAHEYGSPHALRGHPTTATPHRAYKRTSINHHLHHLSCTRPPSPHTSK
ncbi:hypothetical protein BJ165DRAFT_1401562 [Panaeolus papilionaceus]|nr:hypothetical protein BJ165DRAFT_1401562 [Panaeolus papilionaceus]